MTTKTAVDTSAAQDEKTRGVPAGRRPRSGWGLAAAGVLGALAGVAAGVVQPLGPVTAAGAIGLAAASAAVGLAAGALARTRWALLLAPVAWIVGFELGRAGSGANAGLPSMGPLTWENVYGPIAFVLGHLIPWVTACVPLMVGAAWGARGAATRRRPVRLVVVTALTVLVAASLLWPPSVAPVRGDDGRTLPGSVAELVSVELGGHQQWVEVRGARPDLPILLYLSGGPGQSDLAFSRVLWEPLTQDFLVVGWDQRGTGKSYPSLDPATLTPEQAVADTIELARWLTERYGQEKVYVLGESWGSLLGALAVREAPELFHAFLSSGQMVDPNETDRAIYRDLVIQAMGTGNGELVATLASMGEPPYRSALDYGTMMTHYGLLEGSYAVPAASVDRAASGNVGFMGLMGQEYAPLEKANVLRGLLDMFWVMYPQLRDTDLRRDVPALDVPVFVIVGEHELAGRADLAREWFDQLQAPSKRWYLLPNSGHSVAFEQADEFHRILLEDVRAADVEP